MFRILVMNGLLISLIFMWTSAAKDPLSRPSSEKFPTGPQTYSVSEHQVSVNENPLDARRRRRNTCRRELDGKCVRRNRRCPSSLPLQTSPGKPYCSKRRRCCYQDTDTSCQFKSVQERKEYLKLWPGRCGGEDGECDLNLEKDRPEHPPLVLNSANKVVHAKSVRISNGGALSFVCSNTSFILEKVPFIKSECKDGKLLYNNNELEWKNLGCISQILPMIIKKKSSKIDIGCDNNNDESVWAIGFDLHQQVNPFFTVIELCFKTDTKTTKWTKHIIYGTFPEPWDVLQNNPFWNAAGMFPDIDMNHIYSQPIQSQYFNEILGRNIFGVGQYFNRGHLSPKMDFTTIAEKMSTYYYANALPQWIAFNGGNWEAIETSVKNLAITRTVDLEIHNGGFGVLQLQAGNGQDIDIYLANSQNNIVNQVPVPVYFWKIVYDGTTNTAVAFIITNDPLLDNAPDFPFDTSCNLLLWIPFETRIRLETQSPGYSYCCTIYEFMRIFPDMVIGGVNDVGLLV